MDFDVNVQAKVTGLNDVEKLDNHIDNLKTYSPITIDVKSNVDSNLKQLISGSFVNNVKSAGNRIGQNLGQGINNGIKSSIKNIKIDPNKAISTSSLKNKKIAYRTKVNNTIDGTMAELQKLANNNHWKDFKVTGIESANGEIQKLTVTYTEATGAIKQFNMERQKLLTDSGNTPNGLMQVGDVKVIKTATTAVKELNAEIQKVQKKETNVSNNLNNVKTSFTTNDFKSKYGGTAIYQQLEQNIKRAEEAQSKLNAEIQKGDQADFDKINSELKEMSSSAQKAKTQMERLQRPISDLDATTASNKTLGWLKENTKASKEFGTQLKNIASLQSKATTWGELDDLSRQFKDITTQAKQMGLTGLGALGEAKRAFLRIAEFTGMYGVIQNVVQEVPRKMANAVLEVNTATTELKKVSTATASEIDLYFEKATKSAKKYGATINEVINSTADWSRLGYNLKDASIMSDATTLLQVVGDNMTQESSSAGLISILKGFQLQADDANAIVDKINEVANTQPIDTSGIVNALQRSASSLSAANNTLDESIAMITAANSVVQDPDSVGTAFKTISMRIRGAKTELEEAGLETDGMAESTATLRKEMQALTGVDIMLDDNTFKSTFQMMDELADKWSGLSDIAQASVIELMAGKRQGNIMSALLSNWDIAESTLQSSLTSDGSAEKELSRHQESMQYALDRLVATAQEFSNVALDDSFLISAIHSATALLELLTEIVDTLGLVPLIGASIGGIAIFKNLD